MKDVRLAGSSQSTLSVNLFDDVAEDSVGGGPLMTTEANHFGGADEYVNIINLYLLHPYQLYGHTNILNNHFNYIFNGITTTTTTTTTSPLPFLFTGPGEVN